MSLDSIHLRKLLMLMFLSDKKRQSALRNDIREEIAKESGRASNGGDFYAPFWADARSHIFGSSELDVTVKDRIDVNKRRQNLYPQLKDGFLRWWTERRRWTNEPFQPGRQIRANYDFVELKSTVKIDSIISVRDAQGVEHFIYPYFAKDPILGKEAARLGLWLLTTALNEVPSDEIRILDVIRGQTYSIDRNPLIGTERHEFLERYGSLINERAVLKEEYE